jgi:hypothetical protein
MTKSAILSLLMYLIIFWAVVVYIPPITILGVCLFMMFHELGHALVASYYGAFRGFAFYGAVAATKIADGVIPENKFNTTLCSGMMLNILTMSIVMPLLVTNQNGVFGYMLIVVGCGAGDIYCMIKGKAFKEEQHD